MKINFQTACGLIAKEQGYNTWEELLADNEAHTHYYQLAADRYAERQLEHLNVKQSTDVLINHLKSDEQLAYAWQSNIAMQFQDEYAREKEKGYISKSDIHKISNDAAINFLNLLMGV